MAASSCLGCAGYPTGGLVLALAIARKDSLLWTAVSVVALGLGTCACGVIAWANLRGASRAGRAAAFAALLLVTITVVGLVWPLVRPPSVHEAPPRPAPPPPVVDPGQVEAPDPPAPG